MTEDLGDLPRLARSADWNDRAVAGRALAGFVGCDEADQLLIELVCDPHDTMPTQETTEALLERRDLVGVRVLASALAVADDDTVMHVFDSLYAVTQTHAEYEELRTRCRLLVGDAEPHVVKGAVTLLGWFEQA